MTANRPRCSANVKELRRLLLARGELHGTELQLAQSLLSMIRRKNDEQLTVARATETKKPWLDESKAVHDRILSYMAEYPDSNVDSRTLMRAGIHELRCTVSRGLSQLAKSGILQRVGRGKYSLQD